MIFFFLSGLPPLRFAEWCITLRCGRGEWQLNFVHVVLTFCHLIKLLKKKKKCKNYLFQWMGQLIIYLLQTSSVSLLYLLWHCQLHCPKYLRRKDNWFSFRVNTKAENQNYRNLEITIVGKAKDWSNNFFF